MKTLMNILLLLTFFYSSLDQLNNYYVEDNSYSENVQICLNNHSSTTTNGDGSAG